MEAPKTTLDPERYKKKKIDKALIRLQLAVKEKDRKKKASAYQDLAWLYYDVKDYEQSIAYGEKLLDISAQMGNEELEVKANANNVLAWAHKDVGDYEKSQGFCRELLRIGDRLRDEQLKASAYQVQAWLFFADEDYAQSSEQGEKFLNASQNLKDKTLEAKALDVLAWSYLKQGKYEQSQNYGEEFLRISEDLSDQALKAYALEVLAFVFYELENYKQSQKYGQELFRISKELGKKKGEARACEVVAESYIQEGNDQEGRKYAEELLRISKELGKEQEAKAYQVLAKSYSKERKDQGSRKYNKQLLRISKELGNKEQEAKACKALANSYIQGGDFRNSIGYGVELLRISKERGNKELEAHACDLLAKSHAEVGDSELSMEYGKELLSISEELCDKELKSKACCFLGWSDSELEKYEQSKEISKESPRVAKKEEDKTLQAEASGCSGWSDSELEKYEQSKEISKESPRVAKKEEGKTLQAEASGCSELPERQIFNLLRQIEQQAEEDTNNHETGLSENFKRNIKEKGFSISDNQGEGNSMFLALSEQLHLKKRIKISQAELRQTVVQYLKKNPTLLDGTELFHFVDGCSSWDVYLTRMMADGTWGDHVILYGAANLFQTCIHVISSHHDEVMICPEYDASTHLVLGHVHELHYVSLIPHKDTHVPQGGKKPSFEQTGTPLHADKDDNAKVGELIVESEGTSCALKLGAVHLIFPPNAVSESTPTVVYRWKSRVCSPPLQEDEAIVSNVIELSSHDGQQVHFNAMVTLSLSHSAPDLRGYEVVIQRQINKKTNEWEDVHGTKNLSCRQDIEAGLPCHQDIPDLFFPAAQAVISDCSTFAVVCRLKSSPNYTITSTGGLFSHPDYPGVTITIPENAVASESRFNLELKVQEVPNEDFDEEGVFFGPILRMKSSEVVQFFRPVTIQLPVSLRDRQDVKLDPSKCHVRALFLNCEEEKKKWTELTDLVEPTQFDGKFVRIQVKRFSGYSFCVERREENSGSYGLRNLPHLTLSTETQYRRASFVAYFGPHIPEILTLICCPNHLRQGVIEKLEKQGVERWADGSSMKDMIPDEDKAFVFLSGRIRAFNEEDVNNIHLKLYEEDSFKTELQIRLVDSEDLVQVEFRNTLKQTDGTHLLCKLHLTPPSSNMPRAENQNSWELAPQHEIKRGSPTSDELEGVSERIRDKWKRLGRKLKFREAQITEHDKSNETLYEKAYNLLTSWKERDASDATYRVLHKALSDVERRDLAQEFCCQ